jgi:hypothetical protein
MKAKRKPMQQLSLKQMLVSVLMIEELNILTFNFRQKNQLVKSLMQWKSQNKLEWLQKLLNY